MHSATSTKINRQMTTYIQHTLSASRLIWFARPASPTGELCYKCGLQSCAVSCTYPFALTSSSGPCQHQPPCRPTIAVPGWDGPVRMSHAARDQHSVRTTCKSTSSPMLRPRCFRFPTPTDNSPRIASCSVHPSRKQAGRTRACVLRISRTALLFLVLLQQLPRIHVS